MADNNESVIDKLRGPKKGVTGGGVRRPAAVRFLTASRCSALARPRPLGNSRKPLILIRRFRPIPALATISTTAGKSGAGGKLRARVYRRIHAWIIRQTTCAFGTRCRSDSTQRAGDELRIRRQSGIRTMANMANPLKKISEGEGLIRSASKAASLAAGTLTSMVGRLWMSPGARVRGRLLIRASRLRARGSIRRRADTRPVGQSILSLADKIGLKPGGGTTSSITQDAQTAAQRESTRSIRTSTKPLTLAMLRTRSTTACFPIRFPEQRRRGPIRSSLGFKGIFGKRQRWDSRQARGDIIPKSKSLMT